MELSVFSHIGAFKGFTHENRIQNYIYSLRHLETWVSEKQFKYTRPFVQLTWQASFPPSGNPAHSPVSHWMGFFKVDNALEHSILFRIGRLTSYKTWGSTPSGTKKIVQNEILSGELLMSLLIHKE